jgi:hypothetical protein
MKPHIKKLNVKELNIGSVLRSVSSDSFFVVVDRTFTWMHRHNYVICLEFRRYKTKAGVLVRDGISRVRLYDYELDGLEEVVL